MKMKKFLKLIALVATVAMVLSFAACSLFQTKLELKSFTVDRSSVKTNYLIGEEIDFSGIKATAKYSDENLNKVYTYSELTITYDEDITATEGDKEVTVSFNDPHLNVVQTAKVTVKVTAEPIVEPEFAIAVQFERPESLNQFNGANVIDPNLTYKDASFAGQFAVGEKTYIIGNENAFRFNPQFSVLGDDDIVKELENFFSVVELFVEKEDEYVALTATAGEGNLVSYYDGETLIATVDTYKGLYTFAAGTEGLSVKISVLPSEEYYLFESFNPVVLEAEIVKAYNIYEAWELAVIDNDNTDDREGNADWNDTRVWDTFKTEKGIANLTVSGIVLHCDLFLTEDDVPEAFFMTTTQDVVYTNSVTGETKTIPAGTKYLRDWSDIYRRILNPAETFVMEGNFFSISLDDFPIIASPAVFGLEGNSDDYGADFSNSDFIKFVNTIEVSVENHAQVTINNLNIIGNAARDNWVDADGALVSAGGLIFLKATGYITVDFDNIIGNSFFITYFADDHSYMNAINVKCYDSYQNAIYMWGEAKATFTDSYFVGAGGPMAIVSSPDIRGGYVSPILIVTNTVFDSHLSGEEIWFAAIGGNAIVAQMKGLSDGLKLATLGSFVDDSGKMNIQALLMPEGNNASQVVTGIGAQGILSIDGAGMNRVQGADNVHWMTILQISQYAAQTTNQMPPFLTVYDEAGTPYTIFFNGQTFVDLQQRPLGTDASHAAIMAAFQAAEDVTLTMGGISVVLEFYH
ncbi:MAG: hypothetical protein J6Q70_01670 [Clostridia bacterium]|nr:hypothetical protein [Clostridia bacterium]